MIKHVKKFNWKTHFVFTVNRIVKLFVGLLVTNLYLEFSAKCSRDPY